MTELTLEESIQQILPTLPLPIQKFFQQRKLGEVARLLTEQYALHIDQGAILERELILALLGLEGPDEFAETLYKELPISKQTVQDIISDINQEVFVPLREEMMKSGAGNAPQPVKAPIASYAPPSSPMATKGTVPPSVAPGVIGSRPAVAPGVVGPPPQSPSYFHLENKLPLVSGLPRGSIVHPPLPTPNIGRPPVPTQPRPAERSSLRSVLAAVTAPKQTASNRMLEDHEEPHIDISDKVQGASPSVPLKPSTLPLTPAKPYSTDPYREPIDEK